MADAPQVIAVDIFNWTQDVRRMVADMMARGMLGEQIVDLIKDAVRIEIDSDAGPTISLEEFARRCRENKRAEIDPGLSLATPAAKKKRGETAERPGGDGVLNPLFRTPTSGHRYDTRCARAPATV